MRLANVNLALEKATVEFNPSQVAIADIIAKVEKLGYGAHRKEDGQESVDHREKAIQKQKRKFILSVILSFPLLWTMVGHFSFTSFLYLPDILDESMGTNGTCNPGSIHYRETILYRCLQSIAKW